MKYKKTSYLLSLFPAISFLISILFGLFNFSSGYGSLIALIIFMDLFLYGGPPIFILQWILLFKNRRYFLKDRRKIWYMLHMGILICFFVVDYSSSTSCFLSSDFTWRMGTGDFSIVSFLVYF